MTKKYLIIFLCLFSVVTKLAAVEVPLSLDWFDLIPQNERKSAILQTAPMVSHDGNAPATQSRVGATRPELNNSLVKIPGFVIPLEGDSKTTTEFLLVPYFGACIHVPPPPPNQIIYVKFKEGAPLAELWDVVNLVGILKTTVIDHELGQAGYLMEGIRIEPYEDEEVDEYEPS